MEAAGFQLDRPAEVADFEDFQGRKRSIHYALFVKNGRDSVPIGEFRI
jgi:hypothetical protein